MARKRMIDPSFWTDEKIGGIEPIGRLLFMGLISNADDEGRLVGHPSIIKSQVFPYDNISIKEVEKYIKLFNDYNLIYLYSKDTQNYIEIKNFLKYQTINRPTPSKYPSYEECKPLTEYSLNTHGGLIPNIKEKNIKEVNIKEDNITSVYSEIIDYLNLKANTNYKSTGKGNQSLINARLKEKFTLEDFKTVIDKKCDEWLGGEMEKYLTPDTLFSGKFEKYLNQKVNKQTQPNKNKFNNFDEPVWDFEEIKRQEQEFLEEDLKRIKGR